MKHTQHTDLSVHKHVKIYIKKLNQTDTKIIVNDNYRVTVRYRKIDRVRSAQLETMN